MNPPKWRKRMAKDLVRGMWIGENSTFLSFTKSKEYINIENSNGKLDRVEVFEVLSQWRRFYGIYNK